MERLASVASKAMLGLWQRDMNFQANWTEEVAGPGI
jgi:hypothetical protein